MNKVLCQDGSPKSTKVFDQILCDAAISLNACKCNFAEDWCICWTIGQLDNWGSDLVELGFAKRDVSGKVIIPDKQLKNILNFDEKCLSLDGSQGNRGDGQR